MFIYFKRMVFSRESASEDYANVSVNFLLPDIDPTVMCHYIHTLLARPHGAFQSQFYITKL